MGSPVDSNPKWVVLELSPRSEVEDPSEIERAVHRILGKSEVFVPAIVTQVGNDRTVHYLLEGYAFVRRDHSDSAYLKLENSRYVSSVLAEGSGRGRRISVVDDSAVERLKKQVRIEANQGIGVGDTVEIISGHYQSIKAQVVADIPETGMVQVYVRLRSKQSLLTLPRTFLKLIERAPGSPIAHRVSSLREWLLNARPFLVWKDSSLEPLRVIWERYEKFSRWQVQGRRLWSLISNNLDPSALTERLADFERLCDWSERGSRLWSFVMAYQPGFLDRQMQAIESRVLDLAWFDDAMRRWHELNEACDRLDQQVSQLDGGDVTENVLVDGMNLAFRCLYAPGMDSLTDSLGRPTGTVFGFLRGLGSLKKRYPNARLYVTWDSPESSQSRKNAFPGYKANRQARSQKFGGSSGGFDQIAFLVEILPLLGVYQAVNPQVEADDVIATLVRDTLRGQTNVIYSTDKDLLQLVTSTTHVLQPAVGGRKELLFSSPDDVEKLFGVPPQAVVQLRALCGDTSDEIPGVSRVPKNILRALVQAHGTVEKVYQSGFMGLTSKQYDQLQVAKPQVILNVELMTLQNVAVSLIDPDIDVDRSASLLRDIGVNPDPILDTLLGPLRTSNGSLHHPDRST